MSLAMQQAKNTSPERHFQAGGHTWNPLRSDVADLLEQSQHVSTQPLYYGSNHCFLVTVDAGPYGTSWAIYKPARGEYPLYDFANGTLFRREVATWLVSRLGGWELVPPTVVTRGRYGTGSLQLFIESAPEDAVEFEIAELRSLALLDHVLNNADRKYDHCLVGDSGKLWGIDHGLTFHVQPKLRTVLWHFAGTPIPMHDMARLKQLYEALRERKTAESAQLADLISKAEWRALLDRTERLLYSGTFPDPRYKPVPYRW